MKYLLFFGGKNFGIKIASLMRTWIDLVAQIIQEIKQTDYLK